MKEESPSRSGPLTDQAMVAAMLAGNETAFHNFFQIYFPRLYRFALPRLSGDVDATREVVQAVLSKAMRNLESYRGDAALFTWLGQICRNQIVDFVRVRKRHERRVVLIDDTPDLRAALEAVAAPVEDQPAQHLSRAETRALVQSLLDRLPTRYGDALEWKYIEGRSVEEIGELLGVNRVAAQSLLARARSAFRDALETVFGSTVQDVLADMQGER